MGQLLGTGARNAGPAKYQPHPITDRFNLLTRIASHVRWRRRTGGDTRQVSATWSKPPTAWAE